MERHCAASVSQWRITCRAWGKICRTTPDFTFGYRSDDVDLLGYSVRGIARLWAASRLYKRERRGLVTTNFAEAGGFLKTRRDLPAPDIQLHFVVGLVDDHARKKHWGHGFSCHVCLLRPKSRGTVTVTSADPEAAPRIDL